MRYMGFVQSTVAESDQVVRGVVIAQEADLRLTRALSVAPNVSFLRYRIDFKLVDES